MCVCIRFKCKPEGCELSFSLNEKAFTLRIMGHDEDTQLKRRGLRQKSSFSPATFVQCAFGPVARGISKNVPQSDRNGQHWTIDEGLQNLLLLK